MKKSISKLIARQAVKAYSDKPILEKDWKQIKEAIKWAPSSLGFEPYRVLIIAKDNLLRKEIKPLMWNQEIVTSADKLIFFISIDYATFSSYEWLYQRAKRRMQISQKLNEQEIETNAKDYAKKMQKHLTTYQSKTDDWPMKQAYIALGMGMAAASLLKIGSTPVEGFEPNKLKDLLLKHNLIKENEVLAVSLCLGYPKDEFSYGHQGSNIRIRDDDDYKFKEI